MISADQVCQLAHDCGFELAGVAPVSLPLDYSRYRDWISSGFAADMEYLKDHRAALRESATNLLPSARSVVCVGKLYNTSHPYSVDFREPGRAWVSRYAWGDDYHDVLREGLQRLAAAVAQASGTEFEHRICVDTAPLLERAYAREAGLGWIGKNTCLINEKTGSWYFLGELLTSLDVAPGLPAPDRCGTCTRCIDACPTAALTPYSLDARRCISYLTIENRSEIPLEYQKAMGNNVFGCDICQDVCPWNRRAPFTFAPEFAPREFAPPAARLASISQEEFQLSFRKSAIKRAKHDGLLRNARVVKANLERGE